MKPKPESMDSRVESFGGEQIEGGDQDSTYASVSFRGAGELLPSFPALQETQRPA